MHVRHTVSTAEAIFRVFVSTIPKNRHLPPLKPSPWHRRVVVPHTTLRHYSPRNRYEDDSADSADADPLEPSESPHGTRAHRNKKTFGPADVRRYNERIQSEYVRLAEPNGELRTRALRALLAEIDRKTQCIMQTTPNNHDNGGAAAAGGAELPVVRIMASREARDRDKSREKASRHHPASAASKQIELTWLIGANDLDVMMAQLRGFLEDGKRVEIAIGRNKRKGQAKRAFTIEQARGVLEGVRERVGRIEGAAEWKEMEQGKGAAVLFVESKVLKEAAEKRRREGEREKEEGRRRRLEEKERRRGGGGLRGGGVGG